MSKNLKVLSFIIGIYISTTKWSPVLGDWWDTTLFVGYQNYLALFQDIDFLSAIGRTVIILGAAVGLEFCFGLILALLFYGEVRGSRILSSLAILPMTVIPIVSGYTFYLLFLGKGPINQILSTIMGQEIVIIWLLKLDFTILGHFSYVEPMVVSLSETCFCKLFVL